MGKRNKIRYQSKDKPEITITLTGKLYLYYEHEEEIVVAQKGDMLAYPYNDLLNGPRLGDYHSNGFAGYFKLEVFDGREWRLVLMDDIFTHREHYFTKTECPIDTYNLMAEMVHGLAGRKVRRTYREHYELVEEAPPVMPEEQSDD